MTVAGLLALADYHWVLSRPIRKFDLVLVAAVSLMVLLYRLFIKRPGRTDCQETALEIESAFPDLGQRVCTSMEYSAPTPSTMPAWPSLVRALVNETEEKTYRLDFQQIVPWRRLLLPSLAALVLAGLLVAAVVFDPMARVAAMRLFLLPAYYTQLQVKPGNTTVKFGEDVKISADISGRAVEKAEFFSRKAGGQYPWTAVSLRPEDQPTAPLLGTLETSLKKCRDNTEYRVTAGEVESDAFLLTVIHPLELRKISATIEPLPYTKRKSVTVNEGDFQAIEGSLVRFRVELDRPPQTARIAFLENGKPSESMPAIPLKVQGKVLEGLLTSATKDLDYVVQAEADDGMTLDPKKLHISIQPDRKPSIKFMKPAPVIEALPSSEVTMQIDAKDDFGLANVKIVYRIGEGPWETLLYDEKSDQPLSMAGLTTLYLEKHHLNLRDGIVYYAIAEDNYPSGPHKVESELQFIDIRPYKREFEAVKPGSGKGECENLEKLIGKQRGNLQRAFAQSGVEAVDDKVAKKLSKEERALAKRTKKFADKIARAYGPIPCLYDAVSAMESASGKLDGKKIKPACADESTALTNLIKARQNLRTLMAKGKGGSQSEPAEYQPQRNKPDMPEDEDEEDEEDAEEQEQNIQNEIQELAKTEREIAQKIESKCSSCNSPSSSSSPSPSSASKPSESQSASKNQPQNSGPTPGDKQSPESGKPREGGLTPEEAAELAKRQQEAAAKAAEIAEKMKADEAMTDLANQRMTNAEKAIGQSEKSLEQSKAAEGGREARDAAEQLERLSQHVAGLKAMELASKIQKSENMARELAKEQRQTQQNANNNKSSGKSDGQSNNPGSNPGNSQGNNSQGDGQSANDPNEPNESQPDENEKTGTKSESPEAESMAEHERDEVEDAKTIDDILKEAKKDADATDPGLARELEEAEAKNSPKELAAQMEKSAKALEAGENEKAEKELEESAKRWESLADQLETARRNFENPKLEALMAAEKEASELQKDIDSDLPGRQRTEIDKRISDLQSKLNSIGDKDGALQKIAKNMTETLQAGNGGGEKWKQVRPGYYHVPQYYPTAIDRVVHDLQVRIQEIILKDAVLDQDQPVPEKYRKHVEQYYKTLSEDLR
jgi:hypothetical protein